MSLPPGEPGIAIHPVIVSFGFDFSSFGQRTPTQAGPTMRLPNAALDRLRNYRQRRRDRLMEHLRHRGQTFAERDRQRQSEGLLEIALRPVSSVNSFTPRDPGIFWRPRSRRSGDEERTGPRAGLQGGGRE